MKKLLPLLLLIVLGPTAAFASTVVVGTDAATYTNPATVYFSVTYSETGDLALYKDMGAAPVAYKSGVSGVGTTTLNGYTWASGSFSGTVNGTYQIVGVTSAGCGSSSYSACIVANAGAYGERDITVSSPAPSPTASTTAYESPTQDVFYLWAIFFASMIFVVWSFKKR